MKPILSFLAISLASILTIQAQVETPPNYSTLEEIQSAPAPHLGSQDAITDPPDFEVRPMAEWEEIQSLIITWAGFNSINKNIARYAKEECEVIILSDNPSSTESYLMGSSGGGALNNMDNITILNTSYNSIWGRDYGGNTCYRDDVEEPILVDWILQ